MIKSKLLIMMFLGLLAIPFSVEAEPITSKAVPLVETVKSSNSNLTSITLSEGKIEFKKDVRSYLVGVNFNVQTIDINATAEDVKSSVSISGNKELQFGNNVFQVTVTAEDKTISVYKITVVRLHEGESLTNNNLSSLIIAGYKIDFNKDKTTYNIVIKNSDPLTISAVLDDPNSTYKIVNNNNLGDKSEILVVVTARNGDNKIYRIITEVEDNTMLLVALIGGGTLLATVLALLIYFRIAKKKKKKMIEGISKQNVTQSHGTTLYDLNVNNGGVNKEAPKNSNTPLDTVVLNSKADTNQKNNDEIL